MSELYISPDIERALSRRALVIMRQSSERQVTHHTGSRALQMNLPSELVAWGWSPSQIDVVDAGGESGRGVDERPNFQRALGMVSTGAYGIIFVVKDDRLGRNVLHSAELFDEARGHGTLIRIGHSVYNPARASDMLSLHIFAALAEYENEGRRLFMAMTRLAKARLRELRIPLPCGLIWADPTDRAFMNAMRAAGLGEWLAREGHTENSGTNGQSLRIYPFPDSELFKACELRIRWFLETGSTAEVLHRMQDFPWPHPGLWPLVSDPRARIWQPSLHVEWRRRPRSETISLLRTWIRSPALFGEYRFSTEVVEASDDRGQRGG